MADELFADVDLRAVGVLLDAFHRGLERVFVALEGVEEGAEVVVGVQHVEIVAGVAGGLTRRPGWRRGGARVGKLQHLHRQVPAQGIAFLAFDGRRVDGDAVDEIDRIGD